MVQADPLATVTLEEDRISTIFDLAECPRVLDVPIEVDKEDGTVKRNKSKLDVVQD